METLTSEQETYNKLYTRILCLIVEQFHFELQDMEDFAEVVDLRMELVGSWICGWNWWRRIRCRPKR